MLSLIFIVFIQINKAYICTCILGGTTDITAHEVLESGVKEIHHATGGACGGIYVDKNFEELVGNLLGTNFINRFHLHNIINPGL